MKRTIILLSHNRPIQEGTLHSLQELRQAGAAYLAQRGTADVALARSIALTAACEALREHRSRDMILMLDDDMLCTVDQAQTLVDHARETGVAASAMYATTIGTLAATKLPTPEGEAQRWVAGLGTLAVPAALLLELERKSDPFTFSSDKKKYTAFTSSRAENGEWWSEDYTLCRRLGGVHLLPIGVGHLKTIPIYPDEETIAAIATGRPLLGELDSTQLDHVTTRPR